MVWRAVNLLICTHNIKLFSKFQISLELVIPMGKCNESVKSRSKPAGQSSIQGA
jgi:hypothetical protein